MTAVRVGARARGVLLAAVLAVIASSCGSGSSGAAQSVSVFKLAVGDCLVPPTKVQADLSFVKTVACSAPHTQQVFALVRLPGAAGASYPPLTSLQEEANGECLNRFQGFVGVPYTRSSLFITYMLPSVGSWSAGDRTVVCILESVNGPLRRSARGSKF